MSEKDVIEFLVICEKLQIEANSNLTRVEKEFWKNFIDAMKNEATRKK